MRKEWVPGRPMELEQKATELEEALQSITSDLEAHMHFEEQEFLPILTEYAGEIIRRGLLSEHEAILGSIAEAREAAKGLIRRQAGREEVMGAEINIHEGLGRILQLMREHTRRQEVIFSLAEEALAEK